MENRVEFISYDGEYPTLCRGTLLVKIKETKYELKNALRSTGRVWFDKGWDDHVERGKWEVILPKTLEKFRKEIEGEVNANIPQGCCGGCV